MIDEKNGDYAAAEPCSSGSACAAGPPRTNWRWRASGAARGASIWRPSWRRARPPPARRTRPLPTSDRVLEGRYLQTDAHFEACGACCASWRRPAAHAGHAPALRGVFWDRASSRGTVELAAVCLNARNRHRFEDLERLLAQWAEKGLTRADAAEAYVQRQRALEDELSALLRLAGSDRTPGVSDIALYEGWKARFSGRCCALRRSFRGRRAAPSPRWTGCWGSGSARA